ncbi:MAG: hypothetical protein SGPRY_001968 [Prymnesium sp.]
MLAVRMLSLGVVQPVASVLLTRALTSPLARASAAHPRCQLSQGQDLNEQFELYAPPASMDECVPMGQEPRPLGVRKPRGEVHKDGDWHRSVHVWILDGEDRMLLQQRSMQKDTNPGCWDVSCAGHITAGDTSLETAQRELQEEIGMSVTIEELKQSWIRTVPSQDVGSTEKHGGYICREFQDLYLLRCDSLALDQLSLCEGEVAAVKWLRSSEVLYAWKNEDSKFVRREQLYRQIIADAITQR